MSTPEPATPPIRAIVTPVTGFQQNCTIVWCARTKKAAAIDPGGEVDRLLAAIESCQQSIFGALNPPRKPILQSLSV